MYFYEILCNNRPRTDEIIFGDEAEILCDVVPVFMMKTGYICYLGGSVFDGIIKENGVFVLSIISGIIMLKTNEF